MPRLYHITFHAKIHRCSLASFLQKYDIASARSSAPVEKKECGSYFWRDTHFYYICCEQVN